MLTDDFFNFRVLMKISLLKKWNTIHLNVHQNQEYTLLIKTNKQTTNQMLLERLKNPSVFSFPGFLLKAHILTISL